MPADQPGAVQKQSANTCLPQAEYDLPASLSAAVPSKTRFGVPPLGVDVFEGSPEGPVLAESEYSDGGEAPALVLPAWCVVRDARCVAEVTDGVRFSGGILVSASRRELSAWPAEYGIRLSPGADSEPGHDHSAPMY
ncbi:hypothetical protein OG713_10935 [Streptomyces sp. NBC_00723]|uniref:hypothetical protein n=1 Tax=Streptomyces sp. NBC_00723 TaxID=2903673 RepID=UPI00386B81AD